MDARFLFEIKRMDQKEAKRKKKQRKIQKYFENFTNTEQRIFVQKKLPVQLRFNSFLIFSSFFFRLVKDRPFPFRTMDHCWEPHEQRQKREKDAERSNTSSR